jgi:hypothetical protein
MNNLADRASFIRRAVAHVVIENRTLAADHRWRCPVPWS